MKKILIHKAGFKTLFRKKDNSYTFINPEPVNLAKVLSKKYQIVFSSDSDLTTKGNPRKMQKNEKDFYRKILLNGKLYIKDDESLRSYIKIMQEVRKITDIFEKDDFYFITDLKMYNKNKSFNKNLDLQIVSQSKNFGKYGHLEKLFLYNNEINFDINEKENKVVFIGNQKSNQKTDLVKEYLLKDKIKTEIYGRWTNEEITKNKNFKGPIKCMESQKKLRKFKYGILISDKFHRKFNFVTPKYFEYLLTGVIPFIDASYDKDELLIKKDDFRIVNNYEEMLDKIDFLNSNPKFYNKILDKQSEEILPEHVNGDFQLKILEDILK